MKSSSLGTGTALAGSGSKAASVAAFNFWIMVFGVSGVSMRRSARILRYGGDIQDTSGARHLGMGCNRDAGKPEADVTNKGGLGVGGTILVGNRVERVVVLVWTVPVKCVANKFK